MATIYYVTATAPATIYVAGKYAQLGPGQSHGPFSEEEITLVMRSPDRRRLVVTSQEAAAPVIPANVEGTEAYKRPKDTVDPNFKDSNTSNVEEAIKVTSTDVPEPLTAFEEEAGKVPTSDPKAADWHKVEAEEPTTSSMQELSKAGPEEEEDIVEVPQEQPKSRSSSRRRKTT